MDRKYTRILKAILALGAAAGLSACASVKSVDYNSVYDQAVFDATSRAVPVVSEIGPGEAGVLPVASSLKVVDVRVIVPTTLSVSEANRYLPRSDIVWREDPIGNRHQQVQKIIHDALSAGVAGMNGEKEVVLDVVVSRFHALTEKARYSVGGVHAIQFQMRLLHPETGAVLSEPKFVKADFDALGGRAAVRAEAKGITQKVRITNHLINVIRQELSPGEGYIAQRTGLMGAMNQI